MYRIISNERWKPVVRNNIQDYYVISDYGEVYSKFSNRALTPNEDKDGYLIVTLATKTRNLKKVKHKSVKVHRLVAENFIDNPDNKPEVNHCNFNKHDNYYGNLEWSTGIENKLHVTNNDMHPKGEKRPSSKFKEDLIHYICDLIEQGFVDLDIRHKLNLFDEDEKINEAYRFLLYALRTRRYWEHITRLYNY